MNQQLLNTYATLILKKGVNLKQGQNLFIGATEHTYYFARILAVRAYELGAQFVTIEVADKALTSSRLDNQQADSLSYVPLWQKTFDFQKSAEGWANIRIEDTEDRFSIRADQAEALSIYTNARNKDLRLFISQMMENKHGWCVVCAPSEPWAKWMLSDDATTEDLWNLLIPILKLDKPDPAQAWDELDKLLKERVEKLHAMKIAKLHFKSPITDLTLGFRPEAVWMGGADTLIDGRPFYPNIPTEEIFSAPDMYDVEGYVTTTRPATIMGSSVERISLTFKKGEVVDFSASEKSEIVEKFLATDTGSKRLGECALVDETSPIAKSGKVFGSILYDENASCHIALGAAYTKSFLCADKLSSDSEKHKFGCNTSMNHNDIMIGSPQTDVIAFCRDGKERPVMRQGRFVI